MKFSPIFTIAFVGILGIVVSVMDSPVKSQTKDMFAGTSQHTFYIAGTKFVVTRFTDDVSHSVCYFVTPDTIQPYPVSISCVAPR